MQAKVSHSGRLKKAILGLFLRLKTAFLRSFGAPEVLFLAGLGGFYVGLRGIWSDYGSLMACGAILMIVALMAVIYSQPRAK